MLDRKLFVKSVGEALARGALTLKSAAALSGVFNPRLPFGGYVDVEERSEGSVVRLRDEILGNARKHLPRGTRFYVLDGGHHRVMTAAGPKEIDVLAWLYSPVPLEEPRKRDVIAEVTA